MGLGFGYKRLEAYCRSIESEEQWGIQGTMPIPIATPTPSAAEDCSGGTSAAGLTTHPRSLISPSLDYTRQSGSGVSPLAGMGMPCFITHRQPNQSRDGSATSLWAALLLRPHRREEPAPRRQGMESKAPPAGASDSCSAAE